MSHRTFRGINVDENVIYITISGINQIFKCESDTGQLIEKWGKLSSSSERGKFNWPLGLTVESKYAYICDCDNHRIQVLMKENGEFKSQWGIGLKQREELGEFSFPCVIYYNLNEQLFYIGDRYSVQLFEKNGSCLQRLSDMQYSFIYGICAINDRIYVSDDRDSRVQIYLRKKSTQKRATL